MSLNGPVAVAIGWALLHLLWEGVVVAAILAAVLALLERRSANARYVASCAALALLLILGVATAVRVYEPPVTIAPIASSDAPVIAPLPAAADAAPAAIPLVTRLRRSLPDVVLIWLIGVALLSSRLLLTWLRTQRLARTAARAAGAEWRAVVERLAGALQLRRVVRVVESAAVEVPAVIGWLRPMILLPASALTGLAPRQIEMVLAHELAHIRRHDFFVNLLQAVVETLMFYHPAVWWMSHRVRIERENCCDDLAVAVCGDALQYARALARLEELRAPGIAMAANGGSLLDRVRRIAGTRAESVGSRWTAAIAMLSVVAIVVAVPSLPAFAQREEPKKAQTTVVVEQSTDDADDEAPMPMPAPVATPLPPAPPVPAVHGMPAPRVFAMAPDMPPVPGTPVAMAMAAPMAMAAEMAGHHEKDRPLDSAGKLTVDELITLRATNVTPDYIRSMREIFTGLTIHEISGLRALGVTPEWVREMKAAGVDLKTARDATMLKAMKVTPEFVRRLSEAGYGNLSAHELARMAAAGVNADFIRDLEQGRKK